MDALRNYPSDTSESRVGRLKMDLTINIPTMITLAAMIITMLISGVRIYNDINERLNKNIYDVSAIQGRVTYIEAQVSAARAESEARSQAIRQEVKGELTEIKRDIKQLLITRGNAGKKLPEWSE